MLKSFKTELAPNKEQKVKINKTIGTCRYIYNFYIGKNKEWHEKGEPFQSAKTFSVWLNNIYLPDHPELGWIKDVSSKSVKFALECGYKAFSKFFHKESGFPKFKKKNKSEMTMYFVKNNPLDCLCERHRVKIPTLGWVKLKEKGYIPTTKDGYIIRSGTISKQAGKYYVSVLIEVPDPPIERLKTAGIGIDLGVKEFAVLSTGKKYKNINKTQTIKKLEKQLAREQRKLSRQYENKKKGGATQDGKNFQKQKLKVQKLHQRMTNIRTDYINKTIAEIVKTKPSYIVIEDLNVKGMMKNKHLSKAIAAQKFAEFRRKLTCKCAISGIELRIVDRWYPSSKRCHECGSIKKDLKLSDRVYCCDCGYIADRDLNAALNLRDATAYILA